MPTQTTHTGEGAGVVGGCEDVAMVVGGGGVGVIMARLKDSALVA